MLRYLKPLPIIQNRFLILIVLIGLMHSGCLSRKKTDYFQAAENASGTISIPASAEPIISANDLLDIRVSSINPEAARFFNPSESSQGATQPDINTYLVDVLGEIEMPLIGKVAVAGMTTRQIRESLRQKLEKYLQDPTVMVTYASFRITVLGEVKVPGLYHVKGEKINLPEALGLAGDLTIFGDREEIMVIREKEGVKTFFSADLTSREIFSQPYYFLHPGDVIYVPAGKGRLASADAFYRIAPIVISTLTLISLIFYRFNE